MRHMKRTAWAAYDGVNSVAHLILITVLLPWIFDEFSKTMGYTSIIGWSAIVVIALFMVGAFSILFSKFLDNPKLRFIFFVITNILVALLAFYMSTSLHFDFFLLPVASIAFLFFFNIALFIYDSYLIDAAQNHNEMSKINLYDLVSLSGKGWSFGYLLSGVTLLIFWWLFVRDSIITKNALTSMISWSAIIFAFGACIILAMWPETLVTETKTKKISFFSMLLSKKHSERKIRNFLIFAFFIQDGATTLAFFVTLIAKNAYGLSLGETIELFLIVHLTGFISTYNLGNILRFIKPRTLLFVLVIGWITSVILAALAISTINDRIVLYIMSAIIGLLIGTTPSLLRAMYATIIPLDQRTAFYGYGVVFQRTFSFIGPLIVLVVFSITNSYHWVALSGLGLFVPALLILLRSPSLFSYVAEYEGN